MHANWLMWRWMEQWSTALAVEICPQWRWFEAYRGKKWFLPFITCNVDDNSCVRLKGLGIKQGFRKTEVPWKLQFFQKTGIFGMPQFLGSDNNYNEQRDRKTFERCVEQRLKLINMYKLIMQVFWRFLKMQKRPAGCIKGGFMLMFWIISVFIGWSYSGDL